MAVKLKFRRDSATNWSTNNPILAEGEPGFEKDTNKLKIGDGATAWNSLAYLTGGGGTVPTDVIKDSTVGSIRYHADNTVIGSSFVVAGYYARNGSGTWDYLWHLQPFQHELQVTSFPYTVAADDLRRGMLLCSPSAAAALTLPATLLTIPTTPGSSQGWFTLGLLLNTAQTLTISPGTGALLYVNSQAASQTSYALTGPSKFLSLEHRGLTWRIL